LDALYKTNPGATLEEVMNLWNNENDPFSTAAMNNYDGSIRDMVAASDDLFDGGNQESEDIRKDIELWLRIWMDEVVPFSQRKADRGVSGQVDDISQILDTRYVDGDGMEYLQVVSKTLDGALMMDQINNHWLSNDLILSSAVQSANSSGTLMEGKNCTKLEFAWDQAYGYIYALSQDLKDPMATIGADDFFLNKYVKLIDNDPEFAGIAQRIFDAYLVGRAAIVAGDYEEMKKQADIIKLGVSDVMIIRTVFYLYSGVNEYEKPNGIGFGGYLHDTGEGWGFVYSLQFAKDPVTNSQFYTSAETKDYRDRMLGDGDFGLWATEMQTLRDIAEEIAVKMPWTGEDAKNF